MAVRRHYTDVGRTAFLLIEIDTVVLSKYKLPKTMRKMKMIQLSLVYGGQATLH